MNFITWLYFLVENQNKENEKVIFLYGLSLPTDAKERKIVIDSKNISDDKDKSIVVFSKISKECLKIDDDFLDFKGFIKSYKEPLSIVFEDEVLQFEEKVNRHIPSSIVKTPLKTQCLYTDEFYGYYTESDFENKSIEDFVKILEVLEELSGQKFKTTYSKRLGCYEVGQTQEWVDKYETPFEITKEDKGDSFDFYLKVDEKYIFDTLVVHIIFYKNKDEEVLIDTIKALKKDEDTFLVKVSKEVVSLEYWIFDSQNKLTERRKRSFIKSMIGSINIMGSKHNIPKDIYDSKSPLKDKDRIVSPYHEASRSNYQDNNIADKIYERAFKINKRLKNYFEENALYQNGVWFNKNEHDKIINFLNIITQGGAYKITFVDPFVSSQSSIEYLYHFTNQQINMKFISCWKENKSPNDATEQGLSKSVLELQENLQRLESFDLPLKNSCWHNLKSESFHDRFIYIENVESCKKVVFSLSNSLNNMLKNYDLLVVPLKGEVLKSALNYVNNLLLECTSENQIYPKRDDIC